MNNSSIEDILIDKNYNKTKKSKKPFFIIFIVFIILSGLAYGAYYYFTTSNEETNKQLFLKGLSNIDINFFLKNDIYEEIFNKFSSSNFEMNNELTFSTNLKEDEILTENDVDYSKYLIKLNTLNNKESEETYNELNISYSDNNLFNIKLIENKDNIAVFSEEIVNKYVGINKSNKIDFLVKLGIESDYINNINKIDTFKENFLTDKIDIDESEKQEKINNCISFIINNLSEEKFTKQESQISLVKSNSKEVAVQAYKLKLSQEESETILINLLKEIKNDKEFIKKIIKENEETTEENVQNTTNNVPVIPLQQENTQEQVIEDEELSIEKIVVNFLLGQKTETTLEEVEKIIDDTINNIAAQEGNGIEITVYISEVATEKISIILPNSSTFDMEFETVSENEKQAVITYVYDEEVIKYNEDDVAVYSAENTLPQESQSITQKQTNGIKLELTKSVNDASTSINAILNIIKNKEINQKIIVDLETKGTVTSKNFSNECVITYSSNDGEVKANLKNKIDFDKVLEIEDINQENCLFLDSLNDQQFSLTLISIIAKIEDVYNSKKENLNVIDTNAQAPGITQNEQNREELKNLLVSTVSLQMGEAIARGETYTIENLQNLQIQGHIVSVVIIDNVAEVSVDGIKFKIDSGFNLTDA